MKAVIIAKQGEPVAPNVRFIEDYPQPEPSAGQLLVRTEAAALNQLDLWVGRGVPGLELTYPRVSGSDGCGRVEAVGEGVDESWIGRRVLLNAAVPQPRALHPDQSRQGGAPEIRMIGEHDEGCLAEYFTAPAANVLDVGDGDPVEGAAFGLVHLTAWRMLISRAELKPGQTILITGIGGGVALAAFNIARHLGCPAIVTSRHQWKLDRAIELGAERTILDKGEDWSKSVRALTGKRGVDVCVDSIGAAVFESCLKSLAPGGTYAACGCTSGPIASIHLARMFWLQLRIVGSTMGDMAEFEQVVSIFRAGAMKPVIDSVHDAKQAREAFARLESGEQFGKVVVRWS